jgi:hypothetical protein
VWSAQHSTLALQAGLPRDSLKVVTTSLLTAGDVGQFIVRCAHPFPSLAVVRVHEWGGVACREKALLERILRFWPRPPFGLVIPTSTSSLSTHINLVPVRWPTAERLRVQFSRNWDLTVSTLL